MAVRNKEIQMKARIKWIDGVAFLAETQSGHTIIMDGAPEGGGKNLGPRPMELMLSGAGGCSAYDVIVILRKARQQVTDCVIEIDAERAETDPKVFTRIHFHFVVTGHGVDAKHVEKAIKLSADKYCSATAMMAKTAAVTHDFEILEAAAAVS
jgi:putative redox protein